jgi:subtilisin family serine protease
MHSQMQRLSGLAIAITFLACLALPPRPALASGTADAYVPNEVIVRLIPPLTGAIDPLVRALTAQFGLRVVGQLGTLPIYRLTIVNSLLMTPPTLASILRALPSVLYAEPNYIGQSPVGQRQRSGWAIGGDDQAYHAQWAPETLRLPEAHTVSTGAGVTVAVLDTGVDPNHLALAGHLVQGFDFVDLDADPSEEGTYGLDSAYGHGTHVAGLIALAAPDASIMPLRILKPDGTGTSWLLAQAIRYAVANNASVVNMSYSVSKRSLLIDNVLDLATSLAPSAVMVAAAGNNGPSTTKEYPAAEDKPGLLAVAASTQTDGLADFSTRGLWVDVAAPGEGILSCVPNNGYSTWSGTSMAAPLVAGTAALARSQYPSLTAAQVKMRLVDSSAMIDGQVPHRIDAAQALDLPPVSQ